MQRKIELLAPAKSFDAMITAYKAGADAVYAGGQKYSARAYATNFDKDEIIEAIKISHLFGKKFYLAVNTLMKEKEIDKELYEYLGELYDNGLDACIIQDMGVFSFIKKYFPNLDIHISTQASITNVLGAKFFEQVGAKRIVTAREMPINEIRNIRESTYLEIEGFIHGALCYCYSGQCFFSSMLGNRSGNRGRCAQPCRLPYDMYDEKGKKLNSDKIYPLSLKDMCTIEYIPNLVEAGITSLKIEGRMKSIEYLATVTSIYNKYLNKALSDKDYIVEKNDIEKLLDIYNRGGFSKGYYIADYRNMVSVNGSKKKDDSKKALKKLEDIRKFVETKYLNTGLKKDVNMYFYAKNNEPISLTIECENKYATVIGNIAQKSKNTSGNEYIEKALTSLGNTYFKLNKYNYDGDEDIFIPVGELKRLRRSAVNNMYDLFTEKRRDKKTYKECKGNYYKREEKLVSVSVDDKKQFDIVNSYDFVDRIYLNMSTMPFDDIKECVRKSNKKIFMELPQIYSKNIEKLDNLEFDGVIIKNYEEWQFALEKYSEKYKILYFNVYIANYEAIKFSKEHGIDEIFVPIELNMSEIKDINYVYDNMYAYGKIPLMVTKQDASTVVKMRNKDIILKDRKNIRFNMRRMDDGNYSAIYNSVPLNILEFAKDSFNLHFDFTDEDESEIRYIFDSYLDKGYVTLSNFTRGHIKKGVL